MARPGVDTNSELLRIGAHNSLFVQLPRQVEGHEPMLPLSHIIQMSHYLPTRDPPGMHVEYICTVPTHYRPRLHGYCTCAIQTDTGQLLTLAVRCGPPPYLDGDPALRCTLKVRRVGSHSFSSFDDSTTGYFWCAQILFRFFFLLLSGTSLDPAFLAPPRLQGLSISGLKA